MSAGCSFSAHVRAFAQSEYNYIRLLCAFGRFCDFCSSPVRNACAFEIRDMYLADSLLECIDERHSRTRAFRGTTRIRRVQRKCPDDCHILTFAAQGQPSFAPCSFSVLEQYE